MKQFFYPKFLLLCLALYGVALACSTDDAEQTVHPFQFVIPSCSDVGDQNLAFIKKSEFVTINGYNRICDSIDGDVRLFMRLDAYDTELIAGSSFEGFDESIIKPPWDWVSIEPLWQELHPTFTRGPNALRYWYLERIDFEGEGFPENHGSSALGAELVSGRFVARYSIERINPGVLVREGRLFPPSPEHAAILYQSFVHTADNLPTQ